MTFLIWRLHRAHAIVSAVAIVAVTALIVPTGIAIASSYHHAVMNCSVNHVGCGGIAFTVFGHNSVFTSLVQDLAMAFPLVLGILWGAPLVAGQFEAGTEDFEWTQGVARRRWVLANLGWALLVAAECGEVPLPHCSRGGEDQNAVNGPVRFSYFDVQGVAPIAYAVFAMALGIAAGALFRRVVPAITITLVVFPAVRIVTALVLRQQFAMSNNVSPLAGPPPLSWSIGADSLPDAAATTACANAEKPQELPCLAAHGAREHITYLPASRFWPVQGVESGIFLVLRSHSRSLRTGRSHP